MPEPDRLPDRRTDRPPRRDELEAPYRRPLRHVAGVVWHEQRQLRLVSALAPILLAVGGVGVAAGEPLLGLLSGLGAVLIYPVLALWLGLIGRETWRLRRAWAQTSELRSVREARPHAGSEDPEIAHDQFAVTVEDDGWLLTWRFRPLVISEHPGDDEIEVPGRPRYAASVVVDAPFDVQDAARAAEQLVAAQEAAAAREAAAATAAYRGVADATAREELAIEARTTAAALRRATGQDKR